LRFRSFQYKRAISKSIEIFGHLRSIIQQVLWRQTKHFNHLHHLIKLHAENSSYMKNSLKLKNIDVNGLLDELNKENIKHHFVQFVK